MIQKERYHVEREIPKDVLEEHTLHVIEPKTNLLIEDRAYCNKENLKFSQPLIGPLYLSYILVLNKIQT